MFCKNCGKEIPNISKFCKFCGIKIDQGNTKEEIQNKTSEKSVKVTFQRRKKIMGWAIPMKIFIDGKEVAALKNGVSQQVNVTEGKHKVVIDTIGEVTEKEIEFTAGYSNILIELVMKMGLVTGRGVIASIKNEK